MNREEFYNKLMEINKNRIDEVTIYMVSLLYDTLDYFNKTKVSNYQHVAYLIKLIKDKTKLDLVGIRKDIINGVDPMVISYRYVEPIDVITAISNDEVYTGYDIVKCRYYSVKELATILPMNILSIYSNLRYDNEYLNTARINKELYHTRSNIYVKGSFVIEYLIENVITNDISVKDIKYVADITGYSTAYIHHCVTENKGYLKIADISVRVISTKTTAKNTRRNNNTKYVFPEESIREIKRYIRNTVLISSLTYFNLLNKKDKMSVSSIFYNRYPDRTNAFRYKRVYKDIAGIIEEMAKDKWEKVNKQGKYYTGN